MQKLVALAFAVWAAGLIGIASEPQAPQETGHWSYQPVLQPDIPEVRNRSWPAGTIDRFILARLEENGVPPGANASPEVLLRRVYFDLAGLPPSEEQVRQFLADPSAERYTQVIEQLLNSREFGERWARHWLDVVRYGESVTLRGLIFKEAWRYRDYVIDAFNKDMPFDRFLREQVSGDLLEYPSIEDRQQAQIATTFLVLGNINYEEQDKKQLEMDIVDEQLDTIGKAFLAQTIGCARCHDHKFDPIPTKDYYAMAGILKNTRSVAHANVSNWIEVPLALPPEEEEKFARRELAVKELEGQIKKLKEEIAKNSGGSKGTVVPVSSLDGIVIDDAQARKVGEWMDSQYNKPYVGNGYVHDLNTGKGAKTLTFLPELKTAGTFEVRFAYTAGENRATKVPVTILHAAGETVVEVNERKQPPIDGHFVSLGQFKFEAGNQGFVLVSNEGTDGHVIADAVQFLPVGEGAIARKAPKENDPRLAEKTTRLKELEAELKTLTAAGQKRPMVMSVKEGDKISDIPVHHRGSVHNLGKLAPRGFLTVAHTGDIFRFDEKQSGRKQLGEWLASSDNPLTGRVMVNRVWHWLFGAGLVRSTDNFGTTGDAPSHPELLDYLAWKFVQEGWSVKKLVKEIVLSRTYQLSSEAAEEVERRDPENRLWTRANRRRLEAECLRDAILKVSGQLQNGTGGPGYDRSLSADFGFTHQSHARSVYLPVFRNSLPGIFEVFDFADPSMVIGQRAVSTVAPQSLYMMNDGWIIERCDAAARLLLKSDEADEQRLETLYLRALGRLPSSKEAAIAKKFLSRAEAHPPEKTWAELTQAVIASVDFRYLH